MWIDLLLCSMCLWKCLVIRLWTVRFSIELLGPLDLSIRCFERFCILKKWHLLRRAHFHFIALSKVDHLGLFVILVEPNQFYNLCYYWSCWSRSPNQTFWFCLAEAALNFKLLFHNLSLSLFSPRSLSAPWPKLQVCCRSMIESPPVCWRLYTILCYIRSWR